jgi:hypothetical protein
MTVLLAATILFMAPLLTALAFTFFRPGGDVLRAFISFSGAFLLGVVVMHMLPELYHQEQLHIGPWIMGGFLLQQVLETFSRGIEHGHVHHSMGRTLPGTILFSLGIHAFLEGIPFGDPAVAANLPFLAGVALHKVPLTIAMCSVLFITGSGAGHWAYLIAFAMAAPVGVLLGVYFGNEFGGGALTRMLAVAIGMLLHIGTTILFESAPGHRLDRRRLVAVVFGVLFAFLAAEMGH